MFSHDGKELAASSTAASQVAVWDTATGKELRRLDGVRVLGRALAFSPNGKYLAGIGADKAVHVWGATTGKDLRQFAPPKVTPFATPPFTGAAAGLLARRQDAGRGAGAGGPCLGRGGGQGGA